MWILRPVVPLVRVALARSRAFSVATIISIELESGLDAHAHQRVGPG